MKYLPLVSCSFGIEITYHYVSVLLEIARGTLGLEVILPVAAAEEDCVLRRAARCHCGGNKRRRRCRPALVRGRNDRVPLDGINVVRYRSQEPASCSVCRPSKRDPALMQSASASWLAAAGFGLELVRATDLLLRAHARIGNGKRPWSRGFFHPGDRGIVVLCRLQVTYCGNYRLGFHGLDVEEVSCVCSAQPPSGRHLGPTFSVRQFERPSSTHLYPGPDLPGRHSNAKHLSRGCLQSSS